MIFEDFLDVALVEKKKKNCKDMSSTFCHCKKISKVD